MELTNKASETSVQDGNFVDPNNSVNQISKVMDMANGLKSVIAEINGEKVRRRNRKKRISDEE